MTKQKDVKYIDRRRTCFVSSLEILHVVWSGIMSGRLSIGCILMVWSLYFLQKVGSEAELGSEADRGSYTSEVADDNDSVNSADTSSTQEGEFVNPKGVRFLQQQQQQAHQTREGSLGLPHLWFTTNHQGQSCCSVHEESCYSCIFMYKTFFFGFEFE